MGNSESMCCEGTNVAENQDKIIIEVDKNPQHAAIQDYPPLGQFDRRQANALSNSKGPSILKTSSKLESVAIPEVSSDIQKNIKKLQPFSGSLNNSQALRKFGEQVYQGELSEDGRPNGVGTMYYRNGNVFIGEFLNGKADGKGYYFWPDGSYYDGILVDNKANDSNAVYQCPSFKYTGSILNNELNGLGKQQGDNYKFEGTYLNGKRSSGTLKWSASVIKKLPESQGQVETVEQFEYIGQFDQNGNFTGKGKLKSPRGVYTGDFKDGFKDGKGEFVFNPTLRFEGTYKRGVKVGQGTIYNSGRIAYCGEFQDNVPHGKGWIPAENNSQNHLIFRYGISSVLEGED